MKFTLQPFLQHTASWHLFMMLLVAAPLLAQENAEEKILFVKAGELSYSNPDETIKIANHLLKKPGSAETITSLNLLITRGYITKGDYNKSLDYVFQAGKNEKSVNDSLKAEICFFKAEILRKLHLYKLSGEYLSAIEVSGNNPYLRNRIILDKGLSELDKHHYSAALKILENSKEEKTRVLQNLLYARAASYIGLHQNDKASQLLTQAFDEYQSQKRTNKVFETKVLIVFGKVYSEKKEYSKAINFLQQSLEKATALGNIPLQEDIYYQLAANSLALQNITEYKRYYDKFLSLNTQDTDMENEAVNLFYNLISREQEATYQFEQSRLEFYTYALVTLLVSLLICGVVLYRVNKSRRRRLKEIIGYLEVTNNLLVKSYNDKKEPSKKIAISTETEQLILAKLKKFEGSSKYTNKDMSLATLAAQLDVNTKYLSEIINKHYNDNFNMYINKLRINYIIEKLKNEPEYLNYKISYLAEESGFSSHSSFATVFKSITGIAPTVFIDLIGKEVNQKKA